MSSIKYIFKLNFLHLLWVSILIGFSSCSPKVNHFAYNDVKTYRFDDKITDVDSSVVNMILPYKTTLDVKMNEVIGYNRSEMVKAKPSSTLTNWTCDAIKEFYEYKTGEKLDVVLQNYGGIRINSVSAGDITVGKIYEVMPFENNFVVLDCDYENAQKLFYKISQSGGWPISSGSSITIKDSIPTEIIINGQKIEKNKIYKIGLPDYIANGGDDCHFLKTVKRIDTGLLIRDMLINYVRDKKNIVANNEKRITVLK